MLSPILAHNYQGALESVLISFSGCHDVVTHPRAQIPGSAGVRFVTLHRVPLNQLLHKCMYVLCIGHSLRLLKKSSFMY